MRSNGHALPNQREITLAARLLEAIEAQLLIIFEGRGFPVTTRAEKRCCRHRAGGPRQAEQRILAGAARTDTRMSRPGPIVAGRSPDVRALPSRHAMSFAPHTAHHGNVARHMHADQIGALPIVISPRSARPTLRPASW